jgi:hypothetical protein
VCNCVVYMKVTVLITKHFKIIFGLNIVVGPLTSKIKKKNVNDMGKRY